MSGLKSTAQMVIERLTETWDFSNTWLQDANDERIIVHADCMGDRDVYMINIDDELSMDDWELWWLDPGDNSWTDLGTVGGDCS